MNPPLEELHIDIQDDNRGIVFLNNDRTVAFSNKKFADMLGITRKEVCGLDVKEEIFCDDWANQELLIERFFCDKIETLETKLRMYRKNRSLFYAKVVFHHLCDTNDELIYRVIIFTEITETDDKNIYEKQNCP
jgi:PAS domain S-box-containing protein